MLLFKRWVVRAFLCSFAWKVFDLVSLFVLPAWCQNRETSSASQVVDILRLLRDVGSGDVSICVIATCCCFWPKWLLRRRCAWSVVRNVLRCFVGVLHSLTVWFSHVALCEGDCSGRRTTPYGSHVTKTLARNSCFGEFVLCTPRRLIMCGAHWSASRVNLPCSL